MQKNLTRYWLAVGILAAAALVLLGRYAVLAAEKGPAAARVAAEAERGAIVDRTGRPLAMDSALYNIAVWRPETGAEAFASDAARLASIRGIPEAEVLAERDGYDILVASSRDDLGLEQSRLRTLLAWRPSAGTPRPPLQVPLVFTVLAGLMAGEQVSPLRAGGVALICAGVFVVARS